MSPEEKERRRQEFFAESKKHSDLIESAVAAGNSGEQSVYLKLLAELAELVPAFCEHDRSMDSSCMACDEIHKEVFPEHYVACATCKELVDLDEPDDNGNCFSCAGF